MNITTRQAQALALSQRQAIRTLAHQRARQAIERRFQELGIKYRCVTYREVMAEVKKYFDAHQVELCAEAGERVQRWPREGFFGKRAQALAVHKTTEV